ncbi:MAG TPA: alpha-ketoglutarate-dependent dioxygenase AlkB [Verrucomicrobium sp.]|nr:alpha-ketoglutarate-dependent dioxygenase AlkB [Verrucomicrobium sp.]
MDLFAPDPSINLLPCDGMVLYHGCIMNAVMADQYLDLLLKNLQWRHDEAVIYGRHIVTARKVAWYGDVGYAYTYSGTTKQALPWTPELLALKSQVEKTTGASYNSCLANLYHTGDEGMAWHSDDEMALGKDSSIASVSFGAERKFSFKHKRLDETVSIVLEHGSLLEMKGTTQTHWLHRLPSTKKIKTPRVNLTFRTIAENYEL